MSKRLCPNCKYALNEWQTAMCPECGIALDVAVGGPVDEDEHESEPAEDDDDLTIEDPPLKKVSVERRIESLAGAIWSALRCRSYSLDSERWTRVVHELLQEVINEFKERIEKADALYQARFDDCAALKDRLKRYHKKYGCIRCGKPVPRGSTTDQCQVCCHLSQAEAIRSYHQEKRDAAC